MESLRRFHRNRNGAVMMCVVGFIFPVLVTFYVALNAGSALTARMRAQHVADAASYSASLWQARFLNYCAYTRRHMVANYASMSMLTAYADTIKILDRQVYNGRRLVALVGVGYVKIPCDNGRGYCVRRQIETLDRMLESGGASLDRIERIREACDVMNGWLNLSQKRMREAVDGEGALAIMDRVVRDAQGPSTTQKTRFRLNRRFSFASMERMLDERPIPIPEIEAYYDDFTRSRSSGLLPLLGRAGAGSFYGGIYVPSMGDRLCIASIHLKSTPVSIRNDRIEAETKVNVPTSWYCWIMSKYPVFTPIGALPPAGGAEDGYGWHRESYKMANPVDDTEVFELDARSAYSEWEPSVLCAVDVEMDTVPFVARLTRLKVNPEDLFPGSGIRAFSRAKAYFSGWKENAAAGVYQAPNLNYPFWGAKLAAIGLNPTARRLATEARRETVESFRGVAKDVQGNYETMPLNY